MRRENKLALIVGFSVLLVVAVLVSDHLSQARQDEIVDGLDTLSSIPDARAFVEAPLSDRGRIGGPEPRATPSPERRVASGPTVEDGRVDPAPLVPPVVDEDRAIVSLPVDPGPLVIENGRSDAKNRAGGIGDIVKIDEDLLKRFIGGERPSLSQTASRDDQGTNVGGVPGGSVDATVATYKIQEGDTLFELCQELYGDGTRWRRVAEMNPGKVGKDGTVFVGVTIRLPAGIKGAMPRQGARSSEAGSEAGSGSTKTYTVRKGDTLSEIVMREVGSVRDLDRVRALNPWLKDQKDNIRVGQELTLPVDRRAAARGR